MTMIRTGDRAAVRPLQEPIAVAENRFGTCRQSARRPNVTEPHPSRLRMQPGAFIVSDYVTTYGNYSHATRAHAWGAAQRRSCTRQQTALSLVCRRSAQETTSCGRMPKMSCTLGQ